ncbi:hypothetical protein BYT27DRAFT_7243432 [Phlegmacium glaucopus]|nr:hypothetical protein BYT27DRAFT_7243432 [Phlegmacium glaucopus]
MPFPQLKMSFFLILVPFFFTECIAQQRPVFTVSNFLPRPTPVDGLTLGRPVPPQVGMIPLPPAIPEPITDPTSQSGSSSIGPPITPLLLPTSNSPPFLRCNRKNTHLHPKTHKLLSQCRENTFCSSSGPSNGTCVPILCRRDEFPFGFGFGGGGGNTGGVVDPNVKLNELNLPIPVPKTTKKKSKKDRPKDLTTTMVLPPLCIGGTFCPDDGSGCRQQNEVGGSCELGRDEQCAPHSRNLTGITEAAPVCLHLTCMYANATLNQPCIIENTTYVTDLHTGDPDGNGEAIYTTNVIKHNCRSPGLFCDPDMATGPTCQPTKELKKSCRFDVECASGNCAPDSKNANINICAEPAGTPLRIAPWQWGATGFCIVGAMVATSILLTLVHRRHRHERYKELREYYHEQISLRRSILALHAVAAEQYSDEKPHEKHEKSSSSM